MRRAYAKYGMADCGIQYIIGDFYERFTVPDFDLIHPHAAMNKILAARFITQILEASGEVAAA